MKKWDNDAVKWENLAPGRDDLAHITTLQILINYPSDVDRAAWILERTPALQSLDIGMGLPGDVWDFGDEHFDFLKALFRSEDTAQLSAMRLTSLRMTSMWLTKCGKVLPALVKFEHLETLHLIACCDFEPLLQHLTQLRLHLSSICIDRGKMEPCDRATMSAFVASLAAPKRLSLLCVANYDYDGQIDVDSLQQIAGSLEYLRLEDDHAL